MAGAPLGNQNARKENRLWGETLRRAVVQNDAQKLRAIADKLVEMAEGGDVTAMRELGDRLDGKPAQQLVHSGDAENPVRLEKVVREVTRPASATPTPPSDPE